jgi:hypothetical protein
MVGLVRSGLLKRIQSSAQAFAKSTAKMVKEHDLFLRSVDQGQLDFGLALGARDEEWVEKKVRCVSTNRRAYQSSGIDESTPRSNAWSLSSPRGQTKYGATRLAKVLGGIKAATTVR